MISTYLIVIVVLPIAALVWESKRDGRHAFWQAVSNPEAVGALKLTFGAAFIVVLPLVLNQLPTWLGIPLSTAMISHIEIMVFGALIVFFLIVEPHGLARLWAIGKEKLRLWPFPH